MKHLGPNRPGKNLSAFRRDFRRNNAAIYDLDDRIAALSLMDGASRGRAKQPGLNADKMNGRDPEMVW